MCPWERRLRDLSKSLHNCGETYFSPDLFRQNINQFLQTSRTVTFIIQKNKADIPNFDTWYSKQVLTPWKDDVVMTWAKDARNFVEKEGDLEMYSRVDASVIFSHLRSQDIPIEITRGTLLQADIKKVENLAKAMLPPGIADAAALQIERRWVANSLPEHELVWALTYVYSSLYRVCRELSAHLGGELDGSIPHPTDLDPASNDVARARFIKLAKRNVNRLKTVRTSRDPNFEPAPGLLALRDELDSMQPPKSLSDVVARAAKAAEFMFIENGGHYPMLCLYDEDWRHIDSLSTLFADQTDKFLFWRMAAKRAAYLRAAAFVWVSEVWIRDIRTSGHLPIRELPVKGEQLQVFGGAAKGETERVEWNIVRPKGENRPALQSVTSEAGKAPPTRFFFAEVMLEAMRSVRPQRETTANT